MKITAKNIKEWAATSDARGELPLFVRRLVMQNGTITQIAIPARDSVSRPGWDGRLVSEHGDAWVPEGRSVWELGVEQNPRTKADKDYVKRTTETPEDLRQESVYVAVTARHWKFKEKWADEKRAANEWRDVVAYDADDLEAWLEACPSVALAFGEAVGLVGQGVETLTRHWQAWSSQSSPPISTEAFFADRNDAKERLLEGLRKRLEASEVGVYAIRADSAAEATAFVCATVLEAAPKLADNALVVTDEGGWRFVEANAGLQLAIAARPEIAQRPTDNVVTVVATAAGDLASRPARSEDAGFQLELHRPSIEAFRDALVSIGVEESDARRLAAVTGRSWGVFRRRCASNPALSRPAWLDALQADALATMCLLGSWHGAKDADRAIVEKVSAETYEAIERKLRELSRMDDAPILAIGKVWRAKAPLELMELYADRITSDQLDRFFDMVESMLVQPDPQLELDPDKRWMAQVYGKVRAESGLLFDSICDALVKLAVRGPDFPGLAAQGVVYRVEGFVERLLGGADATRWLSLSSHLRPLAEAAPEAFLRAIEASLAQPEPPVARLFSEGTGSEHPLTRGGWQYADLLWALELLAWHPRRLSRVASILAKLTHFPVPENWGNRPSRSLLNIFRGWCPQTTADLEQRLVVLDQLIAEEPDVASSLMDSLLPRGPDIAFPSAKPVWRDDDAGSVHRPTLEEIYRQNGAVADRMLSMAEGNAKRLVRLLDKLDLFDPDRVVKLTSMVAAFVDPDAPDLDRERLRDSVRKMLHWRLNYGKSHPETASAPESQNRWLALYDGLAPVDLITRHRWLFNKGWVDLPMVRDEDCSQEDMLRRDWRSEALSEVYRDLGLDGIARLAEASADAFLVGGSALDVVQDEGALADWVVSLDMDFAVGTPLASMVCGIVRSLSEQTTLPFLQRVTAEGEKCGWTPMRTAAFLRLARDEPPTWDFVESFGTATATEYWRIVVPTGWGADVAAREHAAKKLLDAERPFVALHVASQGRDGIDSTLLLDLLEAALTSSETEVRPPDSWRLAELFKQLEASESIDLERLIRVQFGYIPAFHLAETSALNSLTEAIISRPELFTELVCLVYRPDNTASDEAETDSEAEASVVERAWRLLRDCRRQPGTLPSGEIDADACNMFVEETLRLCAVQGRLKMGQYSIGEIFAHASVGEDGVWPGSPAREILTRSDYEDMRRGFEIGTYNKRGITSRSPTDGGDQERDLAEKYRKWGEALVVSHPYIADTLERIARSYEEDARREDNAAALTRERY
ncbi:hypothetical protein [Thiohalocapsa marina]|uniref:hypothetical protein n=1 Tax=Thiohalocapsa marina TaxID=424902 RepID=UPI0036DE4BBA